MRIETACTVDIRKEPLMKVPNENRPIRSTEPKKVVESNSISNSAASDIIDIPVKIWYFFNIGLAV
jgi:hypothetical protein